MKHCIDVSDIYGGPFESLTAPEGYKFTGEFRPALLGEVYMEGRGKQVECSSNTLLPRLILRKREVRTVEGYYGKPLEQIEINKKYKGAGDFYLTGEFRAPKTGEHWLDYFGNVIKAGGDYSEDEKFLICARKPTVEEVYGAPIEKLTLPAGWELTGEFEGIVAGRDYLNSLYSGVPTKVTFFKDDPGSWRLRLRKKPAQPTLRDVYRVDSVDDLVIPEGYISTGEFRPAKKGEWILLSDEMGEFLVGQDYDKKYPRLILRPITIKDVYGVDNPPIPKGWKMKEFRKIKPDEAVDYLAGGETWMSGGQNRILNSGEVTGRIAYEHFWGYRIVVEREVDLSTLQSKVTVQDVYERIPTIPAGWKFVRFDKPKRGEYVVGVHSGSPCEIFFGVNSPYIIIEKESN